jgi:hypothetical protein
MAYQMTITLTDAEYTALSKEAAKRGEPLEALLHNVLAQSIGQPPRKASSLSSKEIQEYLYHEGIIEHIPTSKRDTQEDDAERDYLAHLFGQGKPVSEMVIEDRGPR